MYVQSIKPQIFHKFSSCLYDIAMLDAFLTKLAFFLRVGVYAKDECDADPGLHGGGGKVGPGPPQGPPSPSLPETK